jgi:Zn-dependent peptidase ImmA (M78 family)
VDLPEVNIPRLASEDYRDIRDEDIEKVASQCREVWSLGLGPISDVMLVTENAGVCVVREEVGTSVMDGLSNWSEVDSRPYALVAADKATYYRGRLDLAHELGHLVLHGHLKNLPLADKAVFKEIERQAFLFAGAFLLPAESFAAEIITPSVAGLLALKERWKASVGAMIKRCDDLGLMSEEYARRIWVQYGARGWRKSEPLDADREPEKPRLFARSVKLLLDEGVRSRADLLNDLRFNTTDIESLCGLPRGLMSGSDADVLNLPQLKSRVVEKADFSNSDSVVVQFHRY